LNHSITHSRQEEVLAALSSVGVELVSMANNQEDATTDNGVS